MKKTRRGPKNISLFDPEKAALVSKALGNETRVLILKEIYMGPKSIRELSRAFSLPSSVVMFHLDILEKADLIHGEYLPSKKGKALIYSLNFDYIHLSFEEYNTKQISSYNEEMPIGLYCEAQFDEYYGMFCDGEMKRLNSNNPFDQTRQRAELLWCNGGKLSYPFSTKFIGLGEIESLSFTLEICSEIQFYRNDWKSDIFFSINNIPIGLYTCQGDFGGTRGILTPKVWPINHTQYGYLLMIEVTNNGTFIDHKLVSKVTLNDLKLSDNNIVLFTLETKKTALHYGGFNIFGKTFGRTM